MKLHPDVRELKKKCSPLNHLTKNIIRAGHRLSCFIFPGQSEGAERSLTASVVSALGQKASEMDQQSAGAAEELRGMVHHNKEQGPWSRTAFIFSSLNLPTRTAWGRTTKHTQTRTRKNTSSPSWPKPRGSSRTNLMGGQPNHHRRCRPLAQRPLPTSTPARCYTCFSMHLL